MILIAPWARNTTNGIQSPKNYPYWEDVVNGLRDKVIQISCNDEPNINGCSQRYNDLSLDKIELLINECNTWISIDSFLPHLGWSLGKPGVVIFGLSDPLIFGHSENINLLKDRKYLRKRQFGLWAEEQFNPDVFVSPDQVVDAVNKLIPIPF